MSRVFIFIYGILSYAIGMAALVWFILYLGAWDFLPVHIDSKQAGSIGSAILINLGLILLFGIQHSVMARPSFKKQITKIIPQAAERSTYVLITGIVIGLICLYWQPINGSLWQVKSPVVQSVLIGAYIFGWIFATLATFLINHFELFGLQQVYLNLLNKPEPSPRFTDRLFYKVVRHPLQLGLLMGIWFTPNMSMTHFMLALSMSIYIFVGLYFEEKDLSRSLGKAYQDYQQRVPMLIPFLRASKNAK